MIILSDGTRDNIFLNIHLAQFLNAALNVRGLFCRFINCIKSFLYFYRHRVIFLPQQPGAAVPRSKPCPFRKVICLHEVYPEPQNLYAVHSYVIFSFSCVLIHRHSSTRMRALLPCCRSGGVQPIPTALRVCISALFPAPTMHRHEARTSLRHQV